MIRSGGSGILPSGRGRSRRFFWGRVECVLGNSFRKVLGRVFRFVLSGLRPVAVVGFGCLLENPWRFCSKPCLKRISQDTFHAQGGGVEFWALFLRALDRGGEGEV